MRKNRHRTHGCARRQLQGPPESRPRHGRPSSRLQRTAEPPDTEAEPWAAAPTAPDPPGLQHGSSLTSSAGVWRPEAGRREAARQTRPRPGPGRLLPLSRPGAEEERVSRCSPSAVHLTARELRPPGPCCLSCLPPCAPHLLEGVQRRAAKSGAPFL